MQQALQLLIKLNLYLVILTSSIYDWFASQSIYYNFN